MLEASCDVARAGSALGRGRSAEIEQLETATGQVARRQGGGGTNSLIVPALDVPSRAVPPGAAIEKLLGQERRVTSNQMEAHDAGDPVDNGGGVDHEVARRNHLTVPSGFAARPAVGASDQVGIEDDCDASGRRKRGRS